MKFNHLKVPSHWEHYWTRYPQGYTILEAIISWVSQVDDMVDNQNNLNDKVEQFRDEIDNFVERFDDRLQGEVTQILEDWQTSGFLEVVISEAIQWQLDDYIETNDQRMSSVTDQLTKIDNIVPVSVTDLGVSNTGEDSTAEMQLAIDSHTHLYIPAGEYSFNDLILNSDTNIVVSKNAHINMLGQIKNTLYNQSDEINRKNIVGGAKRGSYTLQLNDLTDITAGDYIQVYDGGWLNPQDWLDHSKNEDADWWNKHHVRVTNINTMQKTIVLDFPIEFDITPGKGTVVKLDFDKNISIQGGVWNVKHNKAMYDFKYVKGLFIRSGEYYSTTARVLIATERCLVGSISDNNIQFKNNAVIQLFHFTSRFDVSGNIIEVNDVVSGDGTIQLYSYSNNNKVTGNTLTQKHVMENYSDFMMGIVLHTCQNNIVENNVVHGFYYGLASYFGAKYNKFIGNETAYNLISGFYVHQSWYTDIIDNNIHSNGLYDDGGGWVNPQRAGITMQYTSNKINVRGNTFHHNLHDILIMDNADSWAILDNNSYHTQGDFIRIHKSAQAVDTRITIAKMNVSGNTYIPSDNSVAHSFIKNLLNHFEHNIITNNTITNASTAVDLTFTSKFNLFSGNMISNSITGFIGSYESKFNKYIGNTFGNVNVAFSMIGQARLNVYKENLFTNVTTGYGFTDAFNFALDNNSLRLTAPVGLRVPSVEHNSTVEYMERFQPNSTGTAINEPNSWRAVNKNI